MTGSAIFMAMAIVPKVSAALSVAGSASIVYSVAANKSRRSQPYHRIVAGLSVSDVVFSLAIFLGTWMMPRGTPYVYFASGTTATCDAQGFAFNLGVMSVHFYWVLLSAYYFVQVWNIWPEQRVKKAECIGHFVIGLIALAVSAALLPMKMYNPVGWTCAINAKPRTCKNSYTHGYTTCERGDNAGIYQWAFFYGLAWLAFVSQVVSLLLVYYKIRQLEKRNDRHVFGGSQQGGQHREHSKAIFVQGVLYTTAFCVTFAPSTVGEVIQMKTGDYPLPILFVLSLALPLQGFWNCIIYHRPQFVAYRKRHARVSFCTAVGRVLCYREGGPSSGTTKNNGKNKRMSSIMSNRTGRTSSSLSCGGGRYGSFRSSMTQWFALRSSSQPLTQQAPPARRSSVPLEEQLAQHWSNSIHLDLGAVVEEDEETQKFGDSSREERCGCHDREKASCLTDDIPANDPNPESSTHQGQRETVNVAEDGSGSSRISISGNDVGRDPQAEAAEAAAASDAKDADPLLVTGHDWRTQEEAAALAATVNAEEVVLRHGNAAEKTDATMDAIQAAVRAAAAAFVPDKNDKEVEEDGIWSVLRDPSYVMFIEETSSSFEMIRKSSSADTDAGTDNDNNNPNPYANTHGHDTNNDRTTDDTERAQDSAAAAAGSIGPVAARNDYQQKVQRQQDTSIALEEEQEAELGAVVGESMVNSNETVVEDDESCCGCRIKLENAATSLSCKNNNGNSYHSGEEDEEALEQHGTSNNTTMREMGHAQSQQPQQQRHKLARLVVAQRTKIRTRHGRHDEHVSDTTLDITDGKQPEQQQHQQAPITLDEEVLHVDCPVHSGHVGEQQKQGKTRRHSAVEDVDDVVSYVSTGAVQDAAAVVQAPARDDNDNEKGMVSLSSEPTSGVHIIEASNGMEGRKHVGDDTDDSETNYDTLVDDHRAQNDASVNIPDARMVKTEDGVHTVVVGKGEEGGRHRVDDDNATSSRRHADGPGAADSTEHAPNHELRLREGRSASSGAPPTGVRHHRDDYPDEAQEGNANTHRRTDKLARLVVAQRRTKKGQGSIPKLQEELDQ